MPRIATNKFGGKIKKYRDGGTRLRITSTGSSDNNIQPTPIQEFSEFLRRQQAYNDSISTRQNYIDSHGGVMNINAVLGAPSYPTQPVVYTPRTESNTPVRDIPDNFQRPVLQDVNKAEIPSIFPEGYFSRERQPGETGPKMQYYDKNGKPIKMNSGGLDMKKYKIKPYKAGYGVKCGHGCTGMISEHIMAYGGYLPKAGGGLLDSMEQINSTGMLDPNNPNRNPNYLNIDNSTPMQYPEAYGVNNAASGLDRFKDRIYSNDGIVGDPSNQAGYPQMQRSEVNGMEVKTMDQIQAQTPVPSLGQIDTTTYYQPPQTQTQDNIPGSGGRQSTARPYNGGAYIGAGSGAGFKIYTGAERIAYGMNNKNLSAGNKAGAIASGAAAALSGGADLAADILLGIGTGRKEARLEEEWRKRRIMTNNPNTYASRQAPNRGQNSNAAYAEYGIINANPFNPTIEGEDGEWAKTKQGQIKKLVGDSHGHDTDGDGREGVPTNEAQEVITATLPVGKDVAKDVKARYGIKVKATDPYSMIMDKFETKNKLSNYHEILADKSADAIAKRTAQFNLSRLEPMQKELHDYTFGIQEVKKMGGKYNHIDPSISRTTIQQHMESGSPLGRHVQAKYGYAAYGITGSTNVSTADNPYFTPEERAAFAKLFYEGDKSGSPRVPGSKAKWNASPFSAADADKVMTKMFKLGFEPPKDANGNWDWGKVTTDDVQNFIFEKDRGKGFPILEKLYGLYGDTNQGEKNGLKGKEWRDMTDADRETYFKDNIYGIRTGLAQMFLNPDYQPPAKDTPAPDVTDDGTVTTETNQLPPFSINPSSPKGVYTLGIGPHQFLEEGLAIANLNRRQVVHNEDPGAMNALNQGMTNQKVPVFDQNRNDIWSAFRTKMATNTGTPSIRNARNSADYSTTLNALNQLAQTEENAQRQTYNTSNQLRSNLLLQAGANKRAALMDYEDKSNQTEANRDEMLLRIAGQFESEIGNALRDDWDYKLKQSLARNILAPVGGGLQFDPSSSTYFYANPTTGLQNITNLFDNTSSTKKQTRIKNADGTFTTITTSST